MVGVREKEKGSDIFILQYLSLEKPNPKCLGELSVRGEKLRKKDKVEEMDTRGGRRTQERK